MGMQLMWPMHICVAVESRGWIVDECVGSMVGEAAASGMDDRRLVGCRKHGMRPSMGAAGCYAGCASARD